MPRPRSRRRVRANPEVTFFKPQGVLMRNLEVVTLDLEELEALRLKYEKGLDQNECAEKMNTSQSTFQRILSSANKKIAGAVLSGNAIEINTELGG